MFTKEEIQNAIKENKLIAKKKLFSKTPSWDAFIAQTHFEFYNNVYPPLSPDDPYNPDDTIINGVNIRENFYLMVSSSLDSIFFPEQQEVIRTLNTVMPYEADNAISFLNFVGGETPSNIHKDPRFSFYWQCIGTSIWEAHADGEKELGESVPIQSIVLEPGDVIFIPDGVFHTVLTPEPRAAISITYPLKWPHML